MGFDKLAFIYCVMLSKVKLELRCQASLSVTHFEEIEILAQSMAWILSSKLSGLFGGSK